MTAIITRPLSESTDSLLRFAMRLDAVLTGLLGLAIAVAADPFGDSPTARSYLGPLLGQVELWNLWYLVLLAVAVLAVSRVSRAKAAGAVALLLGLRVLTGVAGVAIGNVFSNFGR